MQHLNDPRQITLFDPWAQRFSSQQYATLRAGWEGLFHDVLLELMPAEELAEQFHPDIGRPTKELYAVAGLVFLKEFHNWTEETAVRAYNFYSDVQYALNITGRDTNLSLRSLQRYLALFRELGLAGKVFDAVTQALIEHLELDVSQQRLDSTHVYSNMAMLGRTALMVRAVRRLLTQVLRHHRGRYEALALDLRTRYAKKGGSLPFGWYGGKATAEQRRQARQQVAEDMYVILKFYDGEGAIMDMDTYKQLLRVFMEHCEIIEDAVTVRPRSDSRALQSLSDPDATYDGHKGRGHQAQLSETCSDNNDVQLVTDVQPETAADTDEAALPEVVERLKEKNRKPDELLADTNYGSDGNVMHCAANGVELVAPVKGRRPDNQDALHALDFDIDETTGTVQRCPAGHVPVSTSYSPKQDEHYALFARATCEACPHFGRCPIYKHKKKHYRLKYSPKTLRLEQRRRQEDTPAFKDRYRKRAGVEGLMSALKRRHGFGRLRVRGSPAVAMALYLKTAGHNLLQAARGLRQRRKAQAKAAQSANSVHSGPCLVRFALREGLQRRARAIANALWPRQPSELPRPHTPTLLRQTLLAG